MRNKMILIFGLLCVLTLTVASCETMPEQSRLEEMEQWHQQTVACP